MEEEYQAQLMARRRRLSDLLNQEVEDWRNEMLNRVETVEQRKEKYISYLYLIFIH